MREHARSLIIMQTPIEFFEIPDTFKIELEFKNKTATMDCHCDLSHNNTVTEIYDSSGEIIATCMDDLIALGVTKATVKASHEVDISEVFSCF